MANPPKPKIEITTGIRLGKLKVGDLVRFVQDHPLFLETPVSYLQQGRLREVVCDCGKIRLIAESILATGRLKSCGCYRQGLRENKSKQKLQKVQIRANKRILSEKIKVAQARLATLKAAPFHTRSEEDIQECGEVIRALMNQFRNVSKQSKT